MIKDAHEQYLNGLFFRKTIFKLILNQAKIYMQLRNCIYSIFKVYFSSESGL